MADLAVQPIPRTGLVPVYTAASASDTFANNGRQLVSIKNIDPVGAKTVKFITQVMVDTLAVADLSVSVPPSSTMLVGRFSPECYNNAAGKLEIECPDTSQLSLAVLEPLAASTG